MPEKKNLCAMIPLELHQQVSEAKDAAGLTIGEYMTNLITEYFELKNNGGMTNMTSKTRTMAFQINENLFQRIKAHLDRETERTGRRHTQREFVIGLIVKALDEAESAAMAEDEAAEGELTDGETGSEAESTDETGEIAERPDINDPREDEAA